MKRESSGRGWLIFGGIAVVVVVIAVLAIGSANRIPKLDQSVKASWSEVENQYQRRGDLIGNYVATVKGYADHEARTLIGVIEQRAAATKMTVSDPAAMAAAAENQGAISQALGRLMVVSERYPELKANANFTALQGQLTQTENQIAGARRRYIASVQVFNTTITTIPGRLWNSWFYDYKPLPTPETQTMKADPAARQNPTVNFGAPK